jgi:hypothetical protein
MHGGGWLMLTLMVDVLRWHEEKQVRLRRQFFWSHVILLLYAVLSSNDDDDFNCVDKYIQLEYGIMKDWNEDTNSSPILNIRGITSTIADLVIFRWLLQETGGAGGVAEMAQR